MTLTTHIEDRDLTHEAPHSAGERFGGFAILGRTVDKCRATIAGRAGEYHFNCPLDKQLFDFKGVKADEFKEAVASTKNYEDVAAWLQAHGTPKTVGEIKAWSDKAEAITLKEVAASKSPEDRGGMAKSCEKLGLDFEKVSLFQWLEADDKATFESHAHAAA